jgi:putative DNA primase/helicase
MQIIHNGLIDIAIGRSRKETSWRNKEISWSDLLTKLSTTHRTHETYAEYGQFKKDLQDQTKDIGGFVGGKLSGGRRKPGNVVYRQLITLDIDFAEPGLWDTFCMLYGNAGAMYSTHKHKPDEPRLRLILPLDRPVFSDEYVAIARRIAGSLDIEFFDDTTFQPERLMYWPSSSKDGVFEFQYQDGEWLNADEILGSYTDWKDSSEWPVSSRVDKAIRHSMSKQGDPLEKPGLVGAFCRTYSIAEVIEAYLQDVYEACDVDGRYTYKEGSTAAGVVVYEDKFAYSHHGTDPVSGKLCNAFDLVRLHKFGIRDEDAKEGTPGVKLPSYTAMMDFATKDPAVRLQLGSERLESAKNAFEGMEVEVLEVADDSWLEDMEIDRKGVCLSTINNIILILKNDVRLKGSFALDQFENREVALRNLPWRKVNKTTKYLTDADDAGLWHYLENTYGINNVSKTQAAMSQVLRDNGFHPIRDYLGGIDWDGEERLDSLFIDYLGAADNIYTRTVTRKMFVAAVARVMNPGVKFDYALVLVGDQGQGKSQIIDRMGMQWFSDSFGTVEGKEAYEQIQGVWLVEMGELAGLKKAEINTVKHFISKREDRYRVAYGRRTENFPRQVVFFGTSNNRDFLRDPTGNRRFWPIDTYETLPEKDVYDLDQDIINQLWAEAVYLYNEGEALYLSKDIEQMAYEVQKDHSEQDERTGMIMQYLEALLPVDWNSKTVHERRAFLHGDEFQEPGTVQRDRVCVAEIWCEVLGGQQKDMNRYNTKDIHDMLRAIGGWELSPGGKSRFSLYGIQRAYLRVATKRKKAQPVATID